jgi:hypothetical protein
MGITNMRETTWGWFTAREMAEIDMTPEQAEAARQKWAEIVKVAESHGGLMQYGYYLIAQEQEAKAEFARVVELALASLPRVYEWYVQGDEVIGADEYGNQEIIIGFRSIRKKLAAGTTLPQALAELYAKTQADLQRYYDDLAEEANGFI